MNIFIKPEKGTFPESNWIKGSFEYRKIPYTFDAKVFNEDSQWGINRGKVSKLWVRNKSTKKEVFLFDRGFVVGTQRQVERGMIKALIDYLTEYVRLNWPVE